MLLPHSLWLLPRWAWRLGERLLGVTEQDIIDLFTPLTDRDEGGESNG